MRPTVLDSVYALSQRDPRVVFIGSDLGFGVLEDFHRAMPERCLIEGIAEQNLIGMAAGLALSGKIVYVAAIAPFLTRRAYEQICLDVALHNLPVRLLGLGAGIIYAAEGPTHQATDDLALMRAVPNMAVIAPADAAEFGRIVTASLAWSGPMYIRLGFPLGGAAADDGQPYEIGRAYFKRSGHGSLIITTGNTLGIALEAGDELGATVLHIPTVKPLDTNRLQAALARSEVAVTVEEHSITGGLGSAVAEVIAEMTSRAPRFFRMGLPDAFTDSYGTHDELREKYGLTSENIIATVKGL